MKRHTQADTIKALRAALRAYRDAYARVQLFNGWSEAQCADWLAPTLGAVDAQAADALGDPWTR